MAKRIVVSIILILIGYSSCLQAQPYGNAGDQTAVVLGSPGTPFGYYEYLPADFDPVSTTKYPLILFYHGLGEKGNGTTDLYKVLANGPPKLIKQGKNFNAIVISPQSASGWFSSANFLSLYNYIIANYPIDSKRVYVTGLSAGGGGVWSALSAHQDKIAAAVPICGAGRVPDPSTFLQQTPIWAHHNFSDPTVGSGETIINMNRIANTGNSVMKVYPFGSGNSAADGDYSMQFDTNSQTWSSNSGIKAPTGKLSFTMYKNGGHDSWSKTYNNQDVWDWMFAQKLTSLSLEKQKTEINLAIFPNPTSNLITITSKNESLKNLIIYNLLGNKLVETSFSKELFVDMSAFPSGVYIVKINEDNNEKVMRIIVK